MTTPNTAVTVIEQDTSSSVVEWSLDGFPDDQYNRLLPTQTIQLPTDLLRPVVQVVKLSPDPSGGDVYASKDMPDGHSAPTKVGLRKLATAAGISIVDERRTDDGTNPDVIEVTCLAEMLLPTGVRIHATGMKRIDLTAQVWKSDAHRGKFKSFFLEHVASRAQNRAIRALLSLRGSYPTAIYNRPFAVVSYAPNMAHPEVRARYLDGLAPAAAQLYGPSTGGTKQVGPGQVVEAPAAPDEDPAPATPTVLPGEKLAAAASSTPEEPAWMQSAPVAAAPAAKVDFATAIRDTAAAVEDPEALASPEQFGALKSVFAGWPGTIVSAGIHVLFDDEQGPQDPSRLSGGQAHAIATVHESVGHEAFEREFRALAEKAAVPA